MYSKIRKGLVKLSYKLISMSKEYLFSKYIEHKRSSMCKCVLIGYRSIGVGVYVPKPKRAKQISLIGLMCAYIGFIVVCLITPFTNWLIVYPKRLFNKIGSMWVYR